MDDDIEQLMINAKKEYKSCQYRTNITPNDVPNYYQLLTRYINGKLSHDEWITFFKDLHTEIKD